MCLWIFRKNAELQSAYSFMLKYSKIILWIICILKRKHTICDKSTANNPWQPCGLLDTVSKRPRLAWTTSGLEQDFKLWWQWLHMAIKMDFWWSMLYQSSTLVSLWNFFKKSLWKIPAMIWWFICVCFLLTFVEVHARDQVQEQLLLDHLDFEGPFQL